MTTSNNGTAVAKRETALTPDNIETSYVQRLTPDRQLVLRKQLAPGASDAELEYFLGSAERNGLDPFAVPTQIAAMPSRQQVNGQWITKFTPVVMIDGWREKLRRTGRVEDVEVEWCGDDGVYRDTWPNDKKPLAARASIWLKGRHRPIRFVAHLDEFVRYRSGSNEPQETWKRPRHMLAIRALSHCAKQALMALGLTGDLFDPELLGEDEYDAHGNAQRRFWAQGWQEQTVRRALHISEEEPLSEAIERFGGYAKLEAYMAVKGATIASLPAARPDEDASALYRDPDAEAAVLDARTRRPSGPVELAAQHQAEREANAPSLDRPDFNQRTGVYDGPDGPEAVEPDPGTPEPESYDAFRESVGAPPSVEAVCSVDGCQAPATGFGAEAEPLCEAHGDLAANAEPEGETPPPDLKPLPAGADASLNAFIDAARLHLGLSELVVKDRIRAMGSLTWRNVEPGEWERRWAAIQVTAA